jgi:ech hydrogenase subunit B
MVITNEILTRLLIMIGVILLGPFLGGLMAGIDRRLTARMQSRIGPPILQPFYDVIKLMHKETAVINHAQSFFVMIHLIFMVFTVALFFFGSDLLLTIFALTLASIFLVLAAYATNSPYSNLGADRELLMMLADEPILLLVSVGFYLLSDSFAVVDMLKAGQPAVVLIPGLFLGYILVLTIKMRKSPFDISTSHHAHQELVKGLTTEFAGRTLAIVEIAHWYESLLLYGLVSLFFIGRSPWTIILAVLMSVVVFLLEIVVDNAFARFKWQAVLRTTWITAASLVFINLLFLTYAL